MTNKSTSKTRSKKLLDTTLGKAPSYTVDEPVDLSHIRKPIDTSIFGLSQVLRLFETATDEVRSYVAYECDLIYECRMCRTIYRSLANFILHKRSYCTESFRSNFNSCNTFRPHEFNIPTQETNIFDCDNYPVTSPVNIDSNYDAAVSKPQIETRKKKDLSVVLNRLYDKQESSFITEQCLSEEVSNESQTSEKESAKNNVALQKLNSSNAGVYQTIFPTLRKQAKLDFMKTQVMEIHSILEHNEAILGIDGKVLVNDTEKNSVSKCSYICNVCNHKFSTKKTLAYHIRYKHNNSTLIYPCTECKETFANAWCVFRHLYKVHQKSTTQVRKLRNLIHNSAIKRRDSMDRRYNIVLRSSSGSELPEKANLDDQQWMDNLEGDNDLQRCGGCGRKFERKAALHSHSQFCAKRIAVCNSLKENSGKKVPIEEKPDKTIKMPKNDFVNIDPVRRRKPLVAHKIERFNNCNDVSMLEEVIGPLPHRNEFSLTNKQITDSDNISCQMIKNKPENTSLNNNDLCKSDTFFVGAVAVSKVHKHNINEVSDTENPLEVQQVAKDDVCKEYENDESAPEKESSNVTKTNMINTVDLNMSNNLKQEIDEANLALSIEVCNTNVNSHCDSNLKNSGCNTSIPDVKHEPDTSKPCTVKKSKISLEKKSLKYVDVEKQTCLPCKKHFNTYKLLMNHMALHFSWFRYHCSICKYLSYTKSKCKHHVISKHNIHDKIELSSIVRRISHSKIHETSTNFIKHYKKRKVRPIVVSSETKVDNQEIQENLVATKTDEVCNDKPTCANIQDPSVRQMVMEVIFGTLGEVAEEELLVSYAADNKDIDYSVNDDITDETSECEVAVQNSCATRETLLLKPPESHPQDFSRPVRARIIPLHKDFLYDMKHVLKLKRAKDRRLKSTVKLHSQSLQHSNDDKIKNVSYSASSNINTNENSINCVQAVTMNSDDLLNHVTGDIVCMQ